MPMDLVEITAAEFDVDISLEYATSANFTGEPIYQNAICYLHQEASVALSKAIQTAANVGCRLRIYDAFRPSEAQWILWDHTPDPSFLADPKRGSPHSRGVAIDLTLTDLTGTPLEMGTPFDAFTDKSHHGNTYISKIAQQKYSNHFYTWYSKERSSFCGPNPGSSHPFWTSSSSFKMLSPTSASFTRS